MGVIIMYDETGIESILQSLQRLIWQICNSENPNLSLNDVERKAMLQLIEALTFFPQVRYPFIRVGLLIENNERMAIELVLRYDDDFGIWVGSEGIDRTPTGSDSWEEVAATWEFDEVIESYCVSMQNFESWCRDFAEGIDNPESQLTIECYDPQCNRFSLEPVSDVKGCANIAGEVLANDAEQKSAADDRLGLSNGTMDTLMVQNNMENSEFTTNKNQPTISSLDAMRKLDKIVRDADAWAKSHPKK
jgi:hypothetical protein